MLAVFCLNAFRVTVNRPFAFPMRASIGIYGYAVPGSNSDSIAADRPQDHIKTTE